MNTTAMVPASVPCRPRGLGYNWHPCFICGGEEDGAALKPEMASFVPNRELGQAVVAMFSSLGLVAVLDYREHEPRRVQVKVGACTAHVANLDVLGTLIARAGGRITPGLVQAAVAFRR